jgi:phosphoribosyl 1,2-cyclic phosphodiesterase
MEIQVLGSSSKGNCYRIMAGGSPLLLEAGLPWKEIQRECEFKTSELAGCLVSHGHQDHAKAVPDLIKAGVDCYMTAGTAEALGVSGHRVHVVRALEQFTVGEWTILAFDAVHDTPEPLNFLLAHKDGVKAVYITDTAYCKYRFQGLTHVLIEANYSLDVLNENVANGSVPVELKKRLLKTHMSLETAKDFLRANDLSKVEAVYLLHLSDENSQAERFKREIQELTGKEVYVA